MRCILTTGWESDTCQTCIAQHVHGYYSASVTLCGWFATALRSQQYVHCCCIVFYFVLCTFQVLWLLAYELVSAQ